MRYCLVIVAMSATWGTGIMAKDGKDEGANTARANKAEPVKKGTGDEQSAECWTETRKQINEKDSARDKALVELKKTTPIALEAEMIEICKKPHVESDKKKEGDKGRGNNGHKPRPYQNQLDRLPEKGHNTYD
jgi:hypothetical protein